MKVGLKDMKKAYKKVDIDKIEVFGCWLQIYFNKRNVVAIQLRL